MKLIVGLGNPGREYECTRHNLGYEVIDVLARRACVEASGEKFSGLWARAEIAAEAVGLLKPLTYMNRSGTAVAKAVGFFKLQPEDVLVVMDDLDLPVGRLRLRPRGAPGGHKGLRDCLEKLGTPEVCRLRIGIGAPAYGDTVHYVLSRPDRNERDALDRAVGLAADAAELWLGLGTEKAMNEVNKERTG